MKRSIAAVLGLVFAAALAGCGSTTDSLDFKVPPGYTSKMSTMFMNIWTEGDKDSPTNMLMLMKLPTKWDANGKFDPGTISSSSGLKGAKIQSADKIQICGTHPAILAKMSGTSEQAKGKDMNIELLMTGWENSTYMAMYMYPHDGKPEAAGEAALKSVCEKSTAS